MAKFPGKLIQERDRTKGSYYAFVERLSLTPEEETRS